jgi:hypothetical protein
MKIKLNSVIFVVLGILVLLNFSYFRAKSIATHSVAYTYDQGRDFNKAAEIVTKQDLTFIGPTTGIDGIFHGAWWYYYLTVPFFLFQGNPIGFYYANFIIHLLCLGILAFVLSKYAHRSIAVTIAALISVSPYFVFTSVFVGNNIMVLPAILLFLIFHFLWLEKNPTLQHKRNLLAAAMGISLGLVSEFEFAFGLMIIPVYIILAAIIPGLRNKLGSVNIN